MPTLEHNSLLNVQGRRRPANLTERGNWKDSDFLCPFVWVTGGAIAFWEFNLATTTVIRTVVFTNDAVIYSRMTTLYGTSTTPFASVETGYIEEPTYNHGDAAGNLVVTPVDTVLAPGQAIKGPTVTNAVDVTGYLLRTSLKDRSIEADQTPLDPIGKLMIRAKSAVTEGSTVTGHTTDGVVPIILWEPDYTQVMFDADNLFTLAGTNYRVVGIFAQVLPT